MSHRCLTSNANPPPPRDPLARLLAGSSLVGWSDGELLARFVATRDELAFEVLVVRLGPMVLGVCRRMLGDRGEVDDAFQATFLVLVRRAGAVGRGDLIGPWLHGVAVRVCRQARARQARRRVRERTGVAVEELIDRTDGSAESRVDQAETRASIDDAIARLPEGYRRLIVLCDVEGLSRDEAADRLGWTANMVRGRLARARSQLRARLVRRGCVPPGLTLEAGSGLGLGVWVAPMAPSPVLVATTARVAFLFDSPTGRRLAATLAASSAPQLASGVLQAMVYSSWKVAGTSLLLGGSLVGGAAGVLLAQGPAAPAPVGPVAAPAVQAPPERLDDETNMLAVAVREYHELKSRYDAGKATSHDLIAAASKWLEIELALARTPVGRLAALTAYRERIDRIREDQVREFSAGRATQEQVDEATRALRESVAQLDKEGAADEMAKAEKLAEAPLQTLLQERRQIAQQRLTTENAFYEEGRITIDRLIAASYQFMEADLELAGTPDRRRAIIQEHVDRLTRIHDRETAELVVGRATSADVTLAADKLLEARIMLLRESGATLAPPAREARPDDRIADLERRLTDLERKLDRVLESLGKGGSASPKDQGSR